MIYEGTNEIQAIDLVQRKLLADGGRRAAALRSELAAEVDKCRAQPSLRPFADALATQLGAWAAVQQALLEADPADAEYPLRVADDVLAGIGHALLAWAWTRIAGAAIDTSRTPAVGGRSAAQWLESATFGLQWLLPQAQVHWSRALQHRAALPFLAA
jgi:hypothetical protein